MVRFKAIFPVLSMLLTTQIELKTKDCILLVNNLGIQFVTQLFSTMLFPTRLGRLVRPTVTNENRHQNKYEVNNPKVSSLSLTGLRNRRRRRRLRRRTRNIRCVWGIGHSGTMTEAAASCWQAWVIGDHNGVVYRGRRAWGIDDDNGGVVWGSRRDNASEWTSLTVEAPVCLWDQGIDNNNGSFGIVRRARGISDDNRGVGRGQVIDDTSKGSETTAEEARARRQARVIYDNDRGIGGGRWSQRLQQLQRRRRWRIDEASEGLETTTETEADQRRARWVGNDNGVLIFLAIALLTVPAKDL